MIGTKTTNRYVIAAPSAASDGTSRAWSANKHGGVERADVARRGRDQREERGEHDDQRRAEQRHVEIQRLGDEPEDRGFQDPDRTRQQRQIDAVEAQQQPERAQEDPHPVGEALEAPGDPQPQVDAHRRERDHDQAGRDVGGRAAGGRVRDVERGQQREQQDQRAGVERALGQHGAEDRAPAGAAAIGEHEDPHQFAAARGQHVVGHVADRRQPVGVRPLVANRAEAQDRVPPEAAGRRGPERQHRRDHQQRPTVSAVRELRRLVLLERPVDAAGERSDRDDEADDRAQPRGRARNEIGLPARRLRHRGHLTYRRSCASPSPAEQGSSAPTSPAPSLSATPTGR